MVTEKQITGIKLSPELTDVEISFEYRFTQEADGEDENKILKNEYWLRGKYAPHKDLVDCMKKLRKFALEIVDIDVDSKSLPDWNVSEVKIAGDYVMKKSRVQLILAHEITVVGKSTKRHVHIKDVPQITMYPEKDDAGRYHNAEKMTEILQVLLYEVEAYLSGKYGEEDVEQLPLFPKESVLN
jgi:hypothetical protein